MEFFTQVTHLLVVLVFSFLVTKLDGRKIKLGLVAVFVHLAGLLDDRVSFSPLIPTTA